MAPTNPTGFKVIQDGQVVEVPREIHAEGGEAVSAFVDAALGSGKPLAKMNRAELDAAAQVAGIDPTEYNTVTDLREALSGTRPAEGN